MTRLRPPSKWNAPPCLYLWTIRKAMNRMQRPLENSSQISLIFHTPNSSRNGIFSSKRSTASCLHCQQRSLGLFVSGLAWKMGSHAYWMRSAVSSGSPKSVSARLKPVRSPSSELPGWPDLSLHTSRMCWGIGTPNLMSWMTPTGITSTVNFCDPILQTL